MRPPTRFMVAADPEGKFYASDKIGKTRTEILNKIRANLLCRSHRRVGCVALAGELAVRPEEGADVPESNGERDAVQGTRRTEVPGQAGDISGVRGSRVPGWVTGGRRGWRAGALRRRR